MTDNHEGAVGHQGKTVGDLSDRNTSKLPDELQHENVLLFRDMSSEELDQPQAYQIVFDQAWMPYSYKLPEGWQIIHASTEWHNTSGSFLADLLAREQPCLKIVVNDRDC